MPYPLDPAKPAYSNAKGSNATPSDSAGCYKQPNINQQADQTLQLVQFHFGELPADLVDAAEKPMERNTVQPLVPEARLTARRSG